MILKDALKSAYYTMKPQTLPPGVTLSLGYTFHTEALYVEDHFRTMLEFLRAYTNLTGKVALATVMSGANPRVRDGARKASVSDEQLAERMKQIGEYSELGFHGHYAFDPEKYSELPMQIRGGCYSMEAIRPQIEAELAWFRKHGVTVGPYYSGGWWFQAPELFSHLAERGFELDASVSYSRWFRQANTYPWFRAAGVAPGEPVVIADKMLAVQNLLGCHETRFPDDFIRLLRASLGESPRKAWAFVHSHDFDLKPGFALRALERLLNHGIEFKAAKDFLQLRDTARKLPMPESLGKG